MLPMFPCPCFMLSHSFTHPPPLPVCLVQCEIDSILCINYIHTGLLAVARESFVCLPPMPGFSRFSDFLHCQLALRMRHGGHRPLAIVKQRPHVKYANVICICSSTERAGAGWRRRGSKCSGKRLTKFALNAPVARCQCGN